MLSLILTSSPKLQDEVRVPGITQNLEEERTSLHDSFFETKKLSPECSSPLLSSHWPELGRMHISSLNTGQGKRLPRAQPARPLPWSWDQKPLSLTYVCGCVNEERIEEQNHDSVKVDAGGNEVSAMGSRRLELSA